MASLYYDAITLDYENVICYILTLHFDIINMLLCHFSCYVPL